MEAAATVDAPITRCKAPWPQEWRLALAFVSAGAAGGVGLALEVAAANKGVSFEVMVHRAAELVPQTKVFVTLGVAPYIYASTSFSSLLKSNFHWIDMIAFEVSFAFAP